MGHHRLPGSPDQTVQTRPDLCHGSYFASGDGPVWDPEDGSERGSSFVSADIFVTVQASTAK